MNSRVVCVAVLTLRCATVPVSGAPKDATPAPALVRWTPQPAPDALEPVSVAAAPVERRTFSCGLEVVVAPIHRRALVSMRLMFPRGAAHEPREKAGLTYLSMALLTQRHEQRGESGELKNPMERSARWAFAHDGASLSFGVSHDSSWLGAEAFSKDAKRTLSMLLGVRAAQRHGEDGFTGYRDALLDTLEERETADLESFGERVAQLAFGVGHPYGRRVFGTPTSLKSLGVEEVGGWQKQLLNLDGASLIVTGDVTPADVFAQVDSMLGFEKGTKQTRAPLPPVKATPRQFTFVLPRSPATTTLLCAVKPLQASDGSDETLAVLATVLGRERLMQTLREEHGFAYDASASLLEAKEARAFLLCSRVVKAHTQASMELMTQALKAPFSVTEPELEAAKAMLLAANRSALEDTRSALATLSDAAVRKVPFDANAKAAALQAVTVDAVKAAAARVLVEPQFQWVVSGELKALREDIVKAKLSPLKVVTVAD